MSELGIDLHRYSSGTSALVNLSAEDPAAVLVPIDMEGVDLISFVRAVVAASEAPVVVALGSGLGQDALAYGALDNGARTLIAAPFTPRQLSTTVRHIERGHTSAAQLLQRGTIRVDRARHAVFVSGKPRYPSLREFILLEHLLAASPRVVTLEEIASVLGEGVSSDSVLRVQKCVQRLRRILDAGRQGQPSVIQCIRGAGYRISLET
jgi:DNA-binding response OmpR family regulator